MRNGQWVQALGCQLELALVVQWAAQAAQAARAQHCQSANQEHLHHGTPLIGHDEHLCAWISGLSVCGHSRSQILRFFGHVVGEISGGKKKTRGPGDEDGMRLTKSLILLMTR